MKLVDLVVDRTVICASERSKEIVIFKQDSDAFFGLKAPKGTYAIGQYVPVLLSSDGASISWPKTANKLHARRI